MTAHIKDGASVYFPTSLATVLYFAPNIILYNTTVAPFVSELTVDRHAMFDNLNVASLVIAGNAFAPLLRLVPIRGDYGDIASENFENVQYVPVATSEFDTLERDLSFSSGDSILFQSGRLICKLHFTK